MLHISSQTAGATLVCGSTADEVAAAIFPATDNITFFTYYYYHQLHLIMHGTIELTGYYSITQVITENVGQGLSD